MTIKNGTVVQCEVDIDISRKSGSPYRGWRLIYTDDVGAVQTLVKPIQSLQFNPALKKQVEELKAGDYIQIYMEKKGDYWEVKSITKEKNNEAPPQLNREEESYMPQSSQSSSKGPFVGRDFETKEERSNKQLYIIRQSSLAQAVAFTEGFDNLTSIKVVELANQFTDWVLTGKFPGVLNEDSLEKEFKMASIKKVVKVDLEDLTGDIPQ